MGVSNLSVTDSYDSLLSTTLRAYRPTLVDNVFRGLPLLFWLNSKGRKRMQNGGYEIIEPLMYGENTTVQLYSGYDVLTVTPQEGITSSRWAWKNLAVSVTISREEERKNSGQYKLVNLLQTKTDQAEKSMQWYLNDLLHGVFGGLATTYTGGDTNTVDAVGGTRVDATGKGFNSLDHIVRPAWGMFDVTSATARAHTVGGIQVSTTSTNTDTYEDWGDYAVTSATNPWWMNYTNPGFDRLVRGAVGGTLGSRLSARELAEGGLASGNTTYPYALIDTMRFMYTRLEEGTDKPDLILSTGQILNLYESLLMPLERFEDKSMGDAAFSNLKFKNCTFIHDSGITTQLATTGHSATAPPVPMYMLNSKYLSWVVDSESDFATTPFKTPEDQLARTAQIVLMGNLTCSNRQRQGHISLADIATDGWSG